MLAPTDVVEQILHGLLRHCHRGDQVGDDLDDAQRHLRGVGRVDAGSDRAVARDECELRAVEQPPHGEAMRIVGRHAHQHAPPAGGVQARGDGDEGPQRHATRVDLRPARR